MRHQGTPDGGSIVSEEVVDMVCFVRQNSADAGYCLKVLGEDEEPVRYCLSCQECLTKMTMGRSLRWRSIPGPEGIGSEKMSRKRLMQRKSGCSRRGPRGWKLRLQPREENHDVTLYEKRGGDRRDFDRGSRSTGKQRIKRLDSLL